MVISQFLEGCDPMANDLAKATLFHCSSLRDHYFTLPDQNSSQSNLCEGLVSQVFIS